MEETLAENVAVRDDRGIMLMAMLYKMGLAERIKKECKEKEVIPRNQTGFRKGMGTMDNIYVINYLIGRQLRKGKRLVAHFVDLKTAFDMIDREVLCETMRRRGIREGLVERVKEVLRETKSKVRTGGETGGEFLDGKRGKIGMSIESDVIQYNDIGLGEGNST